MNTIDIKDYFVSFLDAGYSPEEIGKIFEEVKEQRQKNKITNARYDVAIALVNYIKEIAPDAIEDSDEFISFFINELEKAEVQTHNFTTPARTIGYLGANPRFSANNYEAHKDEDVDVKDLIHKLGLV